MTSSQPGFLLVLSALIACGGDDKKDASTSGTPSASAVIGAEGGTLALDNGASLSVPAGALTDDVELRLTYVEQLDELSVAALPEGVEAGGGALVLTPHGTSFLEPVTVTMPTTLSGDEVGLWRLPDEESDEWAPDGALAIEDGVLSFSVLEFSVYSPAAVAAGTCPCFNGAALNAWAGTQQGIFFTKQQVRGVTCSLALLPTSTWSSSPPTRYPSAWVVSPTDNSTQCRIPTTGAQVRTTSAQHNACNTLLFGRFKTKSLTNLQVGAYATGLAASQSVELDIAATPPSGSRTTQRLRLLADEELAWMTGTFPTGTVVSATVRSAPAGATCVVGGGTGAMGTGNVAVWVDCTPPTASGCSFDFQPNGSWTGPLTHSGSCLLLSDAGNVSTIVFHTGAFDLWTFDLEGPDFWRTYAAAEGGDALVILSTGGVAQTGGSGEAQDYSGINALGFGSSKMKYRTDFVLQPVDTAASTFEVSMNVDLLSYTTAYPPIDAVSGEVSFGEDVVEGMYTGTATLSGSYTVPTLP